MSTHIVLVNPQIHWNTGNIGRSCLAAGAKLHLIEPLGFELDDRRVKRAGLDYWKYVNPKVWPSWEEFEREMHSLGEPWFFTTRARQWLWDALPERPGDTVLVFGKETTGFDPEVIERYRDRLVAFPIVSPHVRSINLSSCAAVALYEVMRRRMAGGFANGTDGM